jgi:hypothetical protein
MVKKITILLVFAELLSAKCYYSNCTPTLNSAITNTEIIMQNNFSLIDTRMDELKKEYIDYNTIIEENNKKLENNVKLKSEYLAILSEINFIQNQIVKEHTGEFNED